MNRGFFFFHLLTVIYLRMVGRERGTKERGWVLRWATANMTTRICYSVGSRGREWIRRTQESRVLSTGPDASCTQVCCHQLNNPFVPFVDSLCASCQSVTVHVSVQVTSDCFLCLTFVWMCLLSIGGTSLQLFRGSSRHRQHGLHLVHQKVCIGPRSFSSRVFFFQ